MSRTERQVYRIAIACLVAVSLAMVWPMYLPFSRIDPLVLGLPFALFYLLCLLLVTFLVLLLLFKWESQKGNVE